MAGITGQGTTFNLPNFVGDLFTITPTDTPFLSAIGGLTGGEAANATLFQWQGYDLREADKLRQRLEGANAPTAEARVRFNVNNVVEIHQEAIETSYTKMAATGQFDSTGSNHAGSIGLSGGNPVVAEHTWQISQALKQIARDVEAGFINGSFQNPSSNATARKTRGIMAATATNVTDQGTLVGNGASTIAANGTITEASHGLSVGDTVVARSLASDAIGVLEEDWLYYVLTAPDANTFTLGASAGGSTITFAGAGGTADFYATAELTDIMILDLLQDAYDNGGIMEQETATLMCNSTLKRAITKEFITDKNYQEMSRTVGGVHVSTIETDFGRLNVMLNRHMPSGAVQVVSLEECAPCFLPIPDKGFLFVEPLSRVGAAERSQIYGEIGLKYGNERKHAKLLAVHKAATA